MWFDSTFCRVPSMRIVQRMSTTTKIRSSAASQSVCSVHQPGIAVSSASSKLLDRALLQDSFGRSGYRADPDTASRKQPELDSRLLRLKANATSRSWRQPDAPETLTPQDSSSIRASE